MRVVTTRPAAPAPASPGTMRRWTARIGSSRALRIANVEAAGLAAASLVVILGVCLALWGQLRHDTSRAAGVLHLPSVTSPAEVATRLTTFASEAERVAVAEQVVRRLHVPSSSITHVGALASVTLPVRDIRADRRFVDVRERAASRGEDDRVRLLSSADLSALKARVVVRTSREYLARLLPALVCFLAVFWAAHGVRRLRGATDDPVVLPVLLLLTGLGVMTMVALRDPWRDALIASTFAYGTALGVIALLVASEVDFEASPLRRAVLLPIGLALGLAGLLLVFGTGPGASGVKVNLFGAQPVEIIRLLAVFAIAAALGRRLDLIRELSQPPTPEQPWLGWLRLPRWQDVRPVVVSMALVLTFFFLQKDLGPALVLSAVVIALYAVARARTGAVVVGAAMLVMGFATAYAIGVPATVGQRVRIWLDPWDNGIPGGNQIAHGLWAMASGGTVGAGPGLGSPQFVPEGHTDFVLAALGEQLGVVGVAMVVALYALLAWRCLRIAVRAPGDYSALLGVGVTLAVVMQAMVIAGGVLGVLPLTGVVTPFMSYGRSAMIANGLAIGVVLAIGRRQGPVRLHLAQPVRALVATLAVGGAALFGRAAWVQVVHADGVATAASLSAQADGAFRFEYNPRLVAAARTLERGSILDRNGLVLATSRRTEMRESRPALTKAGVTPLTACDEAAPRCYPLGGQTFSLLGNWATQANWGARNSSYVERDSDARLKGFDDRQRLVEIVNPRTGGTERIVRRDYSDLLPLVRFGLDSTHPDVEALRTRPRDVQLSIDARLQQRVARAVREGIARGSHARGAAVVLDVDTGEVLASVSYPWPDDALPMARGSVRPENADAWFDRVRYGLYPPGSTFKVLVAAAALRSHPELTDQHYTCERLPGGRVGHAVRGWTRPVRDDVKDTTPHGQVDLHKGIVVSCNAYFAQLALDLGPQAILDVASPFQIDVARPSSPASLRNTLPHAAYGQGEVLASPLKMARVVAAIAANGEVRPVHWTRTTGKPASTRLLPVRDAQRLARDLREAVTRGTGTVLARNRTPIAGKTGTAEVDGRPSHSWFIGFAPYDTPAAAAAAGRRRIAFAVLVEHAGYGGRTAAPIAGAIVDAARDLDLVP